MNQFKKKLDSFRPSDSFIIGDSDEEEDVEVNNFKEMNSMKMRESKVIGDSDFEKWV